jgi:hypothetical protein
MDAITHRLERDIRESTAFLSGNATECAEVRAQLMAQLERVRLQIPRQEGLRLEVLIERLTRSAG